MKRTLTALLLLLALLLSACGNTGGTVPSEGAGTYAGTADAETAAPETEPTAALWADLPRSDLEGMAFVFLESERAADTGATFPHGDAETITANSINDAIYNRNRAVEAYLNCKISTIVESGNVKNKVLDNVDAGDDTYTAVLSDPLTMIDLSLEDALFNLRGIDTVRLDKPWYNQKQVDTFTIKNRLYYVCGDIAYSTLMFGACMIYNVDLAERINLPYIYDIVMNGEWTIDRMTEMTAGVTVDLNGDGELLEKDDQFAFVIGDWGNLMNFQYSSDECFVRYDAAQDEFIDAFNIDKMSSLLEKMNRLFNDDNRGLKVTDYTAAFNTCRVLIRTAYVGSCVNHRDMADTFTPIPYPKYDEAQDGYRSMLTGSVLMLGVPVTVASKENAGLVIEALSEHSAGELNDATYERVLSYQTMRTEDALDILKVIHKSLIVDFGYLTLKGSGQQLRWVVGDLVKAKSTDVASFHAKYEDAVMNFYDDLLTKYEKLN